MGRGGKRKVKLLTVEKVEAVAAAAAVTTGAEALRRLEIVGPPLGLRHRRHLRAVPFFSGQGFGQGYHTPPPS